MPSNDAVFEERIRAKDTMLFPKPISSAKIPPFVSICSMKVSLIYPENSLKYITSPYGNFS